MSFERAMVFVAWWEGGLVDDPHDPGGLTNHGISKRQYPDLDIAALTKEQAAEIYRRDYWAAARCGEMPPPVALVVFDAAVNQGVPRAIQCLQRACGATADGIPGPRTMDAAQRAWARSPERLLREICLHRLMHYTAISGWSRYGEGWSKRLLDCLVTATRMLAR